MIVIDVGCHPHPPEESVHVLVERFHPEILFGFDPFPDLVEGLECVGETLVVRRRLAAEVGVGEIGYTVDGITSSIIPEFMDGIRVEVECFSLAEFLRALPPVEVVLKLDAEGAEFLLLTDIYRKRLDERLALVLVEWHGDGEDIVGPVLSRDALLECLRCPVEAWG